MAPYAHQGQEDEPQDLAETQPGAAGTAAGRHETVVGAQLPAAGVQGPAAGEPEAAGRGQHHTEEAAGDGSSLPGLHGDQQDPGHAPLAPADGSPQDSAASHHA